MYIAGSVVVYVVEYWDARGSDDGAIDGSPRCEWTDGEDGAGTVAVDDGEAGGEDEVS